jgi:hypothetical protein
MIQIDAHVVDADAPGGIRIDIRKGKFSEVQPAKKLTKWKEYLS